jgi:hypothetical protein
MSAKDKELEIEDDLARGIFPFLLSENHIC